MSTEIHRRDVSRVLAEGGQLVDVLPEAEFAEWHLPGAINLPLATLAPRATERLRLERPVIVYCGDYG